MSKLKVFSIGLLMLLSFFFIVPGHADTHTAISCSVSDVSFAITAATTGDIVSVPAGDCTWNSAVSISKGIQLIGAGIGKTNITCSTPYCIYSDGGAANNVRVSGFTFNYAGSGAYLVVMNGTGWRVDHNRLIGGLGDGESVVGRSNVSGMFPYGLVDHNQMQNLGVLVMGSYAMLGENNQQHVLWAQNPAMGGTAYVYIEDNTFTKTVDGVSNAVDANYGGRYVFRYNTITTNAGLNTALYLENHSVQGNNRATQRWEIYGNIINNLSSNVYYPFRIRGGTGVILYNSVIGNWTVDGIAFDNVRSYSAVGDGGLCNGVSTWDGNEDAYGYPCRDQIGRGYDTVLWSHSPVGAYAQPIMPAYGAINRTESNTEVPFEVINNSANHIKANRDYYGYNASFDGTTGVGAGTLAARPATCTTGVGYWATNQNTSSLTGMVGVDPATPISGTLYKCTATNTWTLYFTPYTYPHPLTALSPVTVPSPPNVMIK